MDFDVLNRWTGKVQFTAKIDASDDTPRSVKLGLAVRWAVTARANLAGAYLADANLAGANLADANLAGANLAGANLAGANLARANLADAYLADAYLAGANLARANLAGAYLARANLAGAYLARANLAGANLAGAYLADADLRSFKSDLWLTLTENPHEVPALMAAIREGRIDGSKYEGDCACLVGTIAAAKGIPYQNMHHRASDPSERWFAMIRPGDKPGDDSGGGFAAKLALQWCEEWCAATGIPVTAA